MRRSRSLNWSSSRQALRARASVSRSLRLQVFPAHAATVRRPSAPPRTHRATRRSGSPGPCDSPPPTCALCAISTDCLLLALDCHKIHVRPPDGLRIVRIVLATLAIRNHKLCCHPPRRTGRSYHAFFNRGVLQAGQTLLVGASGGLDLAVVERGWQIARDASRSGCDLSIRGSLSSRTIAALQKDLFAFRGQLQFGVTSHSLEHTGETRD